MQGRAAGGNIGPEQSALKIMGTKCPFTAEWISNFNTTKGSPLSYRNLGVIFAIIKITPDTTNVVVTIRASSYKLEGTFNNKFTSI